MNHNSCFGDNGMDTESVRLFVLAADKLNISAAGRELGLAPAVASARLAKLEHSLGADLLHRNDGGGVYRAGATCSCRTCLPKPSPPC